MKPITDAFDRLFDADLGEEDRLQILAELHAKIRADRAAAPPEPPLGVELYVDHDHQNGGDECLARLVGRCPNWCESGEIRDLDTNKRSRCECLNIRWFQEKARCAQFPPWVRHVESRWTGKPTLAEIGELALLMARKETPSRLWHGAPGRGKSYRAAAVAIAACRIGMEVRWVQWPKLIRQLKDAFSRKESTTPILKPLQRWELLIVDELGGRASEWSGEIVEYVIGERCDRDARTIITTNLDTAELEEFAGGRAWSRIAGSTRIQKIGDEKSVDLRSPQARASRKAKSESP
jgi:hypothetical protein